MQSSDNGRILGSDVGVASPVEMDFARNCDRMVQFSGGNRGYLDAEFFEHIGVQLDSMVVVIVMFIVCFMIFFAVIMMFVIMIVIVVRFAE